MYCRLELDRAMGLLGTGTVAELKKRGRKISSSYFQTKQTEYNATVLKLNILYVRT
jgi:hypothetical protein